MANASVTILAPTRENPWSMLLSVLVRPMTTLAQLRGRPAVFPPLVALWFANVFIAYLRVFRGGAFTDRPPLPADAPPLVVAVWTLAPYTSPPFGVLLNLVLGGIAAAVFLAAAGALAGGESRLKEAASLALYAAVPAQLVSPLVTGALILLAPSIRLRGPLASILLTAPPLGHMARYFGVGITPYLLFLLDPLHLWSLALLIVGLVAVMRLSWPKSVVIAGGLYLLVQWAALANAVISRAIQGPT